MLEFINCKANEEEKAAAAQTYGANSKPSVRSSVRDLSQRPARARFVRGSANSNAAELVAATRLSGHYCSLLRLGAGRQQVGQERHGGVAAQVLGRDPQRVEHSPQRTLAASDFTETRKGACRLKPRLAGDLAETLVAWRRHIAPVVEHAAHTLVDGNAAGLPLLTPLTRANQRAAWDRRKPDRRGRQGLVTGLALPATCRDCGAALAHSRRRYCDDCRAIRVARRGDRARETAQAPSGPITRRATRPGPRRPRRPHTRAR